MGMEHQELGGSAGRQKTLAPNPDCPPPLPQAGDSFDLAGLACSLLLGAGYSASVVVGYVPKEVALGSQARDECPWLQVHGVEAPPYVQLPEAEPSWQDEAPPAAEPASEPMLGHPADEPPAAAAAAVVSAEAAASEAASDGEAACPAADASAPAAAVLDGSRPGAAAQPAVPHDAAPGEACESGPSMLPASQVCDATDAPLPAASSAAPASRRLKRYVHAFVLVKPGRRDVEHATLLDPATGLLHSLDSAACTGVEWAYDASNFWLNLQAGTSDGGGVAEPEALEQPHPRLAHLASMDWSFANPNCWLPLLVMREVRAHAGVGAGPLYMSAQCLVLTPPLLAPRPPKEDHAHEAGTVASFHTTRTACSKLSDLLARSSASHLGTAPSTLGAGHSLPLGRLSTVHSPSKVPSQAALTPRSQQAMAPSPSSTGPAGAGPPPGGVGLAHLVGVRTPGTLLACEPVASSLAYLSPSPTSLLCAASTLGPACCSVTRSTSHAALPAPVEMPLSWVPPLELSRERLDTRAPRGAKAVLYRQARRELFASHGECGRWDGMVERLTTYSDLERTAPLCVLELFCRRKDRLVRWHTWLGAPQRTQLCTFEAGAGACLKSLRTAGEEVELEFNADARPDGLARCGSGLRVQQGVLCVGDAHAPLSAPHDATRCLQAGAHQRRHGRGLQPGRPCRQADPPRCAVRCPHIRRTAVLAGGWAASRGDTRAVRRARGRQGCGGAGAAVRPCMRHGRGGGARPGAGLH